MNLQTRVAIVTGGASGIGLAIAARLAQEGATVAIADRNGAAAEDAAAGLGPSHLAVACDVADRNAVDAMVAEVARRHGRLDILVNNAGIYYTTRVDQAGDEAFAAFARVMVDGPLFCVRAAVEHLARSDCPRVLNIASIEGFRGKSGSLAYGIAKGALINMTRELACELAPQGITVNAVAPGFIDTPLSIEPNGGHAHETPLFREVYIGQGFIPLRRDGKPGDIAGPAAFLCGPDSAYVTGQILCVDGGLSATF